MDNWGSVLGLGEYVHIPPPHTHACPPTTHEMCKICSKQKVRVCWNKHLAKLLADTYLGSWKIFTLWKCIFESVLQLPGTRLLGYYMFLIHPSKNIVNDQ